MNKELYIKRENILEELTELRFLVYSLRKFLVENEQKFKTAESIEALKRIKEYFQLKENEYQLIENNHMEIYKELYSTCNHEVAIMRSDIPHYRCLICNQSLGLDRNDIPKQSLISIDTTKDYQVAHIIEETFKEIVHSDKDLIETISNTVEELQYDRNIKVYRRSL